MIKYQHKSKGKTHSKEMSAKLSHVHSACKHNGIYYLYSDREFTFYSLTTGKVLAMCHETDNLDYAISRAVLRKNDGRL